MRGLTALLLAVPLGVACSDDDPAGVSRIPITAAVDSSPTVSSLAPRATGADDVPAPCSILGTDDFAAAGVAVVRDGADVSGSIGLATSASAACQWSGDGTWDLLVGRGGATTAYEFDRGFFAELDTVRDLDAGDAGYILDRQDVATPEDYDHEAGVVVGDVYFTLSTTDDDGADAIERLATLVAERLATSP